MAVTRDREQLAALHYTMSVVLFRAPSKHFTDNLPHLVNFAAKVPTLLVRLDEREGAPADLSVFGTVVGTNKERATIVQEVCERVVARSRELHSRGL